MIERAYRHPAWLIALIGALAAGLALHAMSGQLPPALWWQAIWRPELEDSRQLLFAYAFLPRFVTSLLCGAALALAGVIFQQVMRNPLAEPTTLGVSAGASLALTVALAFFPDALGWGREWIALAGAALATALVFGLVWRRALSPTALILAGMIVALYCGAVAAGVQLFRSPYMVSFYLWGAGSLSQQDWGIALYLLPRLAVAALLCALLVRPLTILGLDEESARGLGVRRFGTRLLALSVAVVLSAVVTAIAGVIGFIGLMAPALVRATGARRLGQQLLWAPLAGAALLCATDQLVQTISAGDREFVPTGAATALLGAPLLLWMLPRLRGDSEPLLTRGEHATPRARRPWLTIALGGLALAAVVWLALHWGQTATGWHWSSASELQTLLPWRAPRLVGAIAAGAMLAMAGTLLQRLTGNPMAAPEILGIGSGAALGLVALALLSSGESRVVQFGVCALGAAGALAIILLLGRRSAYAADRLLLSGIALGALLSVVVSIFMASNDPRIGELQIWMAGVTALINAPQAVFAAIVAIVLLALTPLLRRWLDILPLGQEMPRALGLDVGRSRLLVLMVTALLTAAATLTAGPLGFVGLMAPHLVRLLGIQRTMPQMAAAALLGGLLMAVADWLARTVMFPYEMPAGLLATMLGGPYVMVLLMRRRSGSRA